MKLLDIFPPFKHPDKEAIQIFYKQYKLKYKVKTVRSSDGSLIFYYSTGGFTYYCSPTFYIVSFRELPNYLFHQYYLNKIKQLSLF